MVVVSKKGRNITVTTQVRKYARSFGRAEETDWCLRQ